MLNEYKIRKVKAVLLLHLFTTGNITRHSLSSLPAEKQDFAAAYIVRFNCKLQQLTAKDINPVQKIYAHQMCSFAFLSISCSTVSWYISSGTQQSTGQTAAHCGSS